MTDKVQCLCGEATGVACEWEGPESQTVMIEWMPEYIRASHEAAGARGSYPWNGAVRLRVEASCAARILDADPEWTTLVSQ